AVATTAPDPVTVLATHTRTAFAQPGAGVHIVDRVAQARTFELVDRPTVDESDPNDLRAVLADQARVAEAVRATFDALDPLDLTLFGHIVNHSDGPAFAGLDDPGRLGSFGLLTRSEALVFTDAILQRAYGADRPDFLGGQQPPPSGAPAGFGSDLGYHH